MKIAITGGGGFIGRATIAAAEAAGHTAWAFDRHDGNDILGDLAALNSADCVIHLAGMLGTAELFDHPEAAIEANVVGTLRILRWCADTGARYVGITMPDSSWANVYQATKLCAARLATAWHQTYGVPVSHVRAFNAYGPGQAHGPGHPRKILPAFATDAWAGEPLTIWGSGLQTVDLIHVEDVAQMLLTATRFGNDEVFDAGTGEAMTVRRLANYVNTYTGNTAGVVHQPMRSGETPDTSIVARGQGWKEAGWKPKLNWHQLAQAIEAYNPRNVRP